MDRGVTAENQKRTRCPCRFDGTERGLAPHAPHSATRMMAAMSWYRSLRRPHAIHAEAPCHQSARSAVFTFIEGWYNRVRLHSTTRNAAVNIGDAPVPIFALGNMLLRSTLLACRGPMDGSRCRCRPGRASDARCYLAAPFRGTPRRSTCLSGGSAPPSSCTLECTAW